jgi:hypothetical protein
MEATHYIRSERLRDKRLFYWEAIGRRVHATLCMWNAIIINAAHCLERQHSFDESRPPQTPDYGNLYEADILQF